MTDRQSVLNLYITAGYTFYFPIFSGLKTLGSDFVFGFIQAMDGEKVLNTSLVPLYIRTDC